VLVKQESPEGAKMLEFRKSLPAYKDKERLLAAIARNQVCKLVRCPGETCMTTSPYEPFESIINNLFVLILWHPCSMPGYCNFWGDRMWENNTATSICIGGGNRVWPRGLL
jgi:hypothetical protein